MEKNITQQIFLRILHDSIDLLHRLHEEVYRTQNNNHNNDIHCNLNCSFLQFLQNIKVVQVRLIWCIQHIEDLSSVDTSHRRLGASNRGLDIPVSITQV